MNTKQKTAIGIASVMAAIMALYPPAVTWCGSFNVRHASFQFKPILSRLDPPECGEKSEWTSSLTSDRLFAQWVLLILGTAALVRAFSPKAFESLKHYRGAKFRFTKYTAAGEGWKQDHCAGCWATFAEYQGPDILHEAYVIITPYKDTSGELALMVEDKCSNSEVSAKSETLIFICAQCFSQCRDALDFRVELPPA